MAYAHFVEGCLATSTEIFGVSFIFAALRLRSATGKQRHTEISTEGGAFNCCEPVIPSRYLEERTS